MPLGRGRGLTGNCGGDVLAGWKTCTVWSAAATIAAAVAAATDEDDDDDAINVAG